MTAIPDPIAALVAFLKADAAVAALASTRIYGAELPESVSAAWDEPRNVTSSIVVSPAGGLSTYGGGYQQFGDLRVDVRCYGSSPRAAHALWQAVYGALKQMNGSTKAGCRLYWAKPAGGPIPLRDPDADWPFTNSTWQVMAAEVAA